MPADEPGFLTIFLSWGGNLIGGAALGAGINWAIAPGSDWALAVGVFALPLIFGIGMKFWYASLAGAVMNRLAGALWTTLRGGGDFRDEAKASLSELRGKPMPGTGAFVWIGVLIGPLAGLLTAFSPASGSVALPLVAWSAVGIGYGLILRWLARSGRLPPPDEA